MLLLMRFIDVAVVFPKLSNVAAMQLAYQFVF